MEINPLELLTEEQKEQLRDKAFRGVSKALEKYDFEHVITDAIESIDLGYDLKEKLEGSYLMDEIMNEVDVSKLGDLIEDKLKKALQ